MASEEASAREVTDTEKREEKKEKDKAVSHTSPLVSLVLPGDELSDL